MHPVAALRFTAPVCALTILPGFLFIEASTLSQSEFLEDSTLIATGAGLMALAACVLSPLRANVDDLALHLSLILHCTALLLLLLASTGAYCLTCLRNTARKQHGRVIVSQHGKHITQIMMESCGRYSAGAGVGGAMMVLVWVVQ